ncbi:metal-dependent transcriptional regulator [Ferrimicrobium sp.]|uniref:metal-dependent transcriptional regulator n=1 Tax=Ferrimicrobium sp. TaxID=2926050 RepID=UPI00263120CF|nr:metal-dependent transcriptional regulator [Ferrimicrobium sp.]
MTIESHPPLEEYLETIWYLREDSIEVIPTRLAERLGRSLPTVTQRLDRLVAEGYLARPSGKQLEFTQQGQKLAEGVVRKHRLAECLLYQVIGLSYVKLHIEAGRWEHAISDEVETLITTLLGNPLRCPHGNPIPYGTGTSLTISAPGIRLNEADIGVPLKLQRITEELEEDEVLMATLVDNQIFPGSELCVHRQDARTLTIDHLGHSVTLDAKSAALLVVDPITRDAS